eukprot:7570799-Pyramimonas_sp.AAC.1
MSGGTMLAKLNSANRSLERAARTLSTHDDPPEGSLAVSSSIGLRALIKKRNVAQDSSLLADGAPRRQLFPAVTPEKARAPPGSGKPEKDKASPRVSHSRARAMRGHPDTITIEVGDKDVAALRCAHPRDQLSVNCDMLRAVRDAMVASARGEPAAERGPSLPMGARKQNG